MKIVAVLFSILTLGSTVVATADAAAAPRTSLSLNDGWSFRQVSREELYPAEVPGVVHLDLLRNELIAEPFYAYVEEGLQWIGKTDWEYRKEFSVSQGVIERKNIELVFDGLDTYAEIYLNDELVLEAINMYRWWRVPVEGLLKAEDNELRVIFRSPITKDLHRVAEAGYQLPAANDKEEGTSPYTRKAPYSFGWDWGPRFVTAGIWKPVRLEAWDDVRLVDVFIRQIELGEKKARLEADVEMLGDDNASGSVTVEIHVDGAAVASEMIRLEAGTRAHTVSFEIDDFYDLADEMGLLVWEAFHFSTSLYPVAVGGHHT
ncbi:MAG: hypothetical protein OEM62_08590 [Acidobacteriota bacterium]|nr:hypothetical protein [Acidobacteriota bacterium]